MKLTKSVLNGKNINLTGDNTIITSNNFNVDKDGNMQCSNATITGGNLNIGDAGQNGSTITLYDKNENDVKTIVNSWGQNLYIKNRKLGYPVHIEKVDDSNYAGVGYYFSDTDGVSSRITCDGVCAPTVTQTSLEEYKKNIEKLQDNALNTLKTIDIYKYNLKNEKDTDKKHIGFVIGDKFNYSKEVTSLDNQGVDNYSFTSLCCKAIQELSTKVEELENKIKEMEEK